MGEHRITIFFLQVALLIGVGRILGELMQRIRQPSVIGQLLAGIILGPSIFGAIAPSLQESIFPVHTADRQMLSAVSELGILMLLLLTGMETDLALVKRVRKTAIFISLGGILLPFACGYGVGEVLPAVLIPDPSRRLFTSLFLAVALSISSVKIVAAVLREVDFLRRDLGQIILASAITDDVIGWTSLAFIGGMAAHGRVVMGPVLLTMGGTVLFLVISFTVGHRWVARLIRWTNDNFVSEMSVISLIIVLMIGLALLTDWIGVHTVLGAFVAGIMIGQSPILTQHIEEELKGLIVAVFMPVFFGVAGLSIDLKLLAEPRMLGLAGLFIVIASIGKLGGCYIGGRLARLSNAESLAIGVGMNARGSTEIVLATLGLAMGVLNQSMFTIIVVMATVTTLCMPPALRWALGRVPMPEGEKTRLEAEAAEEKDLMPKVERVLVAVDASKNGQLAAHLAGGLIGARELAGTVIDFGEFSDAGKSLSSEVLFAAATKAQEAMAEPEPPAQGHGNVQIGVQKPKEEHSIRELVSVLRPKEASNSTVETRIDAILEEAKNGYGFLVLGLDESVSAEAQSFQAAVQKIVRAFEGHVAVLIHGSRASRKGSCEKILVPTTGADYSRFGAEVGIAIAKGCGGTITALHVTTPSTDNDLPRRPEKLQRPAHALLDDIVALGEREGVRVIPRAIIAVAKERAILRQAIRGRHELIVLGTKVWSGEELHFGNSAEAIIVNAAGPILIVKT